MGTLNVTGAGGTAGHPSNGRIPYLVENTIDLSQLRSDTGPDNGDVLQIFDIPAETLIMEAGIEVITALSSSATMGLGITGVDVDIYVSGANNAAGYKALTNTARHIVNTTADTLDIVIGGADSSAGKIRVFAVLCDVSGIEEDDKNTDAQHDTVS